MKNQEICFQTATELTRLIRAKDLSATEVMEAHLAQIERVNPKVNAIVTFLPEKALEQARAADKALAHGEDVGPLHGLPVAYKDLALSLSVRPTHLSSAPVLKRIIKCSGKRSILTISRELAVAVVVEQP
jgi:amidase